MLKFLRLADAVVVTETDIDPLCTTPSMTFKPDSSLYAPILSIPTPYYNPLTHTITEGYPEKQGEVWTQQWVVTPLSVEAAALAIAGRRRARWDEIKLLRDGKTQTGGYFAAGKWFHSDTFSRTQHLGLMMMGANIPAGLMWKTMDGSFVEMTPTLAGQVFAAAATQDTSLFTYAEYLHGLIQTAENPDTINVTAGWPETFIPI